MAATEKRTLEIVAKVVDFATRPFATMRRSITQFARDGVSGLAGMVRSTLSLRTAIAGLAVGFAALKGGTAINSIVETNSELAKLARGTGSAAEELITLRDALGLAGVEGTRFRGLIASLTKGVGQALNDSTAKSAQALGKLGLTLKDLRTTDPVGLFDRLAASLEQFATPQEKAAALLEVFPKATGDIELLIDALGRGSDQFRNLLATARFFGGELTADAIASIERLDDALDVLKLSVEGVGRTAVAELAARFAPGIERLAAFVADNRELIAEGLANVATVIGKAVLAITTAIVRLTAFLTANGTKIVEALEDIPLIGAKVAEALRGLFDVPNLSQDARAVRDEMQRTARSFVEFDEQVAYTQKRIQEAELLPSEFGPQQLQQLRNDLDQWVQLRANAMARLQEQQARFQAAGGGAFAIEEQLTAARAGGFADTLSNLTNFENLPAPSTDLSPIIKALFGADGVVAAEERVRSFTDGVADGLERVRQKWTDFGAAGEEAVSRVVDGGLDQLADAFSDVALGLKSAREAFREFAKAVVSELVKVIVKLAIMYALQLLTGTAPVAPAPSPAANGAPLYGPGFEEGGQTDRPVVETRPLRGFENGGQTEQPIQRTIPLRRFERGGIVREPTIALFGEGRASKGEAFVPLPDGRRIPVAMQGGSGGGNTVHITIHAMDSTDVQRVLFEQRETLSAIWTQEASSRSGMRQTIRGAG